MRDMASCSAGRGAAAQHIRKKPGSAALQSLPANFEPKVSAKAQFNQTVSSWATNSHSMNPRPIILSPASSWEAGYQRWAQWCAPGVRTTPQSQSCCQSTRSSTHSGTRSALRRSIQRNMAPAAEW